MTPVGRTWKIVCPHMPVLLTGPYHVKFYWPIMTLLCRRFFICNLITFIDNFYQLFLFILEKKILFFNLLYSYFFFSCFELTNLKLNLNLARGKQLRLEDHKSCVFYSKVILICL